MRKTWVALTLLAGCTPFEVSERELGPEAPGGKGTLVLRAKPPAGHVFNVVGLGSWTTESEGPIAVPGLEPGSYPVEVTGKHLSRVRTEVEVRAGVETTLTFHAKTARRSQAAGEAVAVTGKTLFYAGFGVLYVVVWLPIRACVGAGGVSGQSDDVEDGPPRPSVCSSCGYASCRCPRAPERSSPSKSDDPKPRVRDLLKQK